MRQIAQVRRWTNDVDKVRRLARRVGRRPDNETVSGVLAECLATCEKLLQDLVEGEEERVRLLRAASEGRDNWRRLFETTPLPCVLTDTEGIVRGANRTASLLLNVSAARLTGQLFLHFISERQRAYDALHSHVAGERPLRIPLRLRPREKAVVAVDAIIVSDVGFDCCERLWFLIPHAQADPLRTLTTPIEANDCEPRADESAVAQ